MNTRTYALITATMFAIMALLHLVRLFQETPALIGDCQIPLWWSWIGVAVTAFLSVTGFRIARRELSHAGAAPPSQP